MQTTGNIEDQLTEWPQPSGNNHLVELFPPLGSLDADHPHVLRVVQQLAVEALVLKNGPDVVPVVLCHAAPDGQVVGVAWETNGNSW